MSLTRGLVPLLVCVALAACKEEEKYPDLSGYVKKDATQAAPKVAPKAAALPVAPVSAVPATPATPAVETPTQPVAANQEAPKSKPVRFARSNGVAAEYSRFALGQGKYFESLVAQVEGYRSQPYYDNKGIAIGFGYNASYQKPAMNRRAGLEVLKSEQAAKVLEGLSQDFERTTLPPLQVNPEQAMGMSMLLKPNYEDPMREWIPGYDKLTVAQQAVLAYHAYKVGGAGAKTYPILKAKIAVMLANPTPENTRAAGAEFQYRYTVKGEVKTDTRSTVYMQSLWNSPQTYADLIGGKSSSFVATLPEFKNTGKKAISDDDIADPIGEVKLEMERTGKRIPMTLEDRSRPNRREFFLPNF